MNSVYKINSGQFTWATNRKMYLKKGIIYNSNKTHTFPENKSNKWGTTFIDYSNILFKGI